MDVKSQSKQRGAATRFGPLVMTSGVVCLGGLAASFVTVAGHSGWGVLHNQTGLFFLGVLSILATPFWLLAAAIAALGTDAPWRAHELALLVLVIFSVLATVAAYSSF
jgi:hypothetical protein